MNHSSSAVPDDVPEPPFTYEDFSQKYPVFLKTQDATPATIQKDIARELEATLVLIEGDQDRSYAVYTVMIAYINAVLQDDTDKESLARAIYFAQDIIGNRGDKHRPNIRAYAVSMLDTLLLPSVAIHVRQAVMGDSFFQQFGLDTNGTVMAFRGNLLRFGDSLYRMTEIKMKLAHLQAMRLGRLKGAAPRSEGAIRENTIRQADAEKRVRDIMAEALASLEKDRAGQGPFGSPGYLVGPLYYRALTADQFLRATGEMPFGRVESLYQEALQAAEVYLPNMKPFIDLAYTDYLNSQSASRSAR